MIDNDHSPDGLEYWARDLERELTAAQAESLKLQEQNAKLRERIGKLEVAGDRMAAAWDKEWLTQAEAEAIIDDWYGSKEATP